MNRIILLLLAALSLSFGSADRPQLARNGKDRALFFATNSYDKLSNLSNPIKNARSIAKELRDSYGFDIEVVENPSILQIDEKINAYKQAYAKGEYESEGQLLIFFSGHGVMRGKNGYYMARDSDPNRPQFTAMEYGYYRNEIDQINCKHILVAIDACHSATFDPGFFTRNDRRYLRKGEEIFDKVLANHEQYKARCFWTSDGVGKETPDQSNFAYHLLEGLRSEKFRGKYLRSSELFSVYMERASPKPGGGRFGSDDPTSCFLFFGETPDLSNEEAEIDAWNRAKRLNSPASYADYIQAFPNGDFVAVARQRKQKLEADLARQQDIQAWKKAKALDTPKAYQAYLDAYPNGLYADAARANKAELEAKPPSPSTSALSSSNTGKRDIPEGMVFVPGGTFQMGDVMGDKEGDDETVHTVQVSDFFLQAKEVTFDEYDAFCDATGRQKPDDSGWGRGQRPVIYVDWYDCIEYCNWKSEMLGLQKAYTINKSQKDPNNKNSYDKKKWRVSVNWEANGYRLPTEAEWEYAARQAGQKVRFGNGQNMADPSQMNFDARENYKKPYSKAGTYRGKTLPTGSFDPNSLGLYDMSGNVWEWCWDWYGTYPSSKEKDPTGPTSGSDRVLRGGSWGYGPQYLRAAYRYSSDPDVRGLSFGFRPLRIM